MSEWTSWGIVFPHGRNDKINERVLAVEGVYDGRDLPLFTGTVGEFVERWDGVVQVHKAGRMIWVTQHSNFGQR